VPPNWTKVAAAPGLRLDELQGQALATATEARSNRLNRLGNLTIVTSPLNSAMSNSPWEIKRTQLNMHSKLLLNARIAERANWDEQAIDEHGAWLAERLVAIWPGPDIAKWM
jgi:hypothetical protein